MTYNLSIPDMSCQHCVNRITKAVGAAGGKIDAINLDTKLVTITAELSGEKLVALIEEAGYTPQILQ